MPIALALAQFAPLIAGFLNGKNGDTIAEKAIDIAQTVTGLPSAEEALAALRASPLLAGKFQEQVLEQQARLAEIAAEVEKANIAGETENKNAINETLRSEAQAEHWPTYSWRPAIGFAVALGMLGTVIIVLLAYGGVIFGNYPAATLDHIPAMLGAMAMLLTGVAAPILGVASYWRGKMQADPAIPTLNRG